MKNRITLLLLAIALTACATRQSPNELIVEKYEKLKIPKKTITLPVPTSKKRSLG